MELSIWARALLLMLLESTNVVHLFTVNNYSLKEFSMVCRSLLKVEVEVEQSQRGLSHILRHCPIE